MIAVAGGLASACFWAATGFLGQRAARAVGELSAFAWAAVIGLALAAIPAGIALAERPVSATSLWQLALAGALNVAGLIAQFSALARGRVSMIVPVTSAEGAMAALAAVIGGARIGPLGWVALAGVLVGIAVTAAASGVADRQGDTRGSRRPLALGALAAVLFGTGLYVQGHAAAHVALGLAIVPPSAMGAALVTAPLASARRLASLRGALLTLPAIAAVELLGFLSYVLGARQSVPVAAVLSAQYATITVAVGMVFLGDRPSRLQLLGYALIIASVGVLSAAR